MSMEVGSDLVKFLSFFTLILVLQLLFLLSRPKFGLNRKNKSKINVKSFCFAIFFTRSLPTSYASMCFFINTLTRNSHHYLAPYHKDYNIVLPLMNYK